MRKRHLAAVAVALAVAATTGTATAEESITGTWRTPKGDTASIQRCGEEYCITSETGANKGKRIGRFTETKDGYAGELTDPSNNRTYTGTGSLSGSSLKLTGCVLKILCRSQTWTKL